MTDPITGCSGCAGSGGRGCCPHHGPQARAAQPAVLSGTTGLLVAKDAEIAKLRVERQRLWDLCRHQRSELLVANLITDDEYAALAQDHSAVARLETYDSLRAERDQARERVAELEKALRTLVDRLDFVHEHEAYKSVWFIHQLHAGPYRGPQYATEYEAAREALTEPDATGTADDQIQDASVDVMRQMIERSGLSNEKFIRRYNELTPEQIKRLLEP